MNRRDLILASLGLGLGAGALLSRRAAAAESSPPSGIQPLEKSLEEWQRLLEPEQYHVLFEEGTERAFTSPLNDEKRAGHFLCAACYLPLFSSETKYDSGTGWPSFYAPLDDSRLGTKKDWKIGYPRTEYHCVRCGGHQGHVFMDGPPPTGLRYCNNGVALRFVPEGEALPELRS